MHTCDSPSCTKCACEYNTCLSASRASYSAVGGPLLVGPLIRAVAVRGGLVTLSKTVGFAGFAGRGRAQPSVCLLQCRCAVMFCAVAATVPTRQRSTAWHAARFGHQTGSVARFTHGTPRVLPAASTSQDAAAQLRARACRCADGSCPRRLGNTNLNCYHKRQPAPTAHTQLRRICSFLTAEPALLRFKRRPPLTCNCVLVR